MTEIVYDKINEYSSVKISLASPEDIRSWSYGEVKKPETINYRTYRAEKDGLFCERIFGPERNWECFCGKYKGIKHKGIICDRCGVKITHSRVRRKRMGHINLAAPIVHIWFFKAMPSRLGTLLGMKTTSLERIIYFQDYVVIDTGSTPLKEYQMLSEEEYKTTKEKYGEQSFKAGMGAEAIRTLLQKLDLVALSKELREELNQTKSKQRAKEIIKRLEIVEAFRDSGNKTEWMVLSVVPVIPPDLRPLVLLESGNFATSDLNDLYRRIINRNNRLKKLIDLNAPEVIIRNEKRMLQQAVDALFDNTRGKRPVLGSNNRPLKSLTDMIKGKQGRFRENLLGKRVDYSARSVIVVGPELKLHQCGLPKKIALELFQPFIIRRLKELGLADTIKSAKKMLGRKDKEVWDILDEVVKRHPVLLNRAPTLHRMGIQAFEPILVEGNAIKLHPLVCRGFNADFDGDQMAVHLPLSIEAQAEAITLMLSTNNIFSPASGEPIITPTQDIVLGCSYLTMSPIEESEGKLQRFSDPDEVIYALSVKKVKLHTMIEIRLKQTKIIKDKTGAEEPKNGLCKTTVGRVIFNSILPEGMPFYNYSLDLKGISKIIQDCYKLLGREKTIVLLDDIKETGFKACTKAGLSFAITDIKMPAKKQEIIDK
ncbi:MAG: DNA-directed RNA polymerase subunit beta', partial [Candidatus Brocadiales bacterium]|nr:DNA-directed RNA polymerase subunit beta' [Candidatus Brocadiales bacterium]